MSYLVTRRSNEIGLRMALGAERSQVLWLVMRESLLLVAFGITFGVPVAFICVRLLSEHPLRSKSERSGDASSGRRIAPGDCCDGRVFACETGGACGSDGGVALRVRCGDEDSANVDCTVAWILP